MRLWAILEPFSHRLKFPRSLTRYLDNVTCRILLDDGGNLLYCGREGGGLCEYNGEERSGKDFIGDGFSNTEANSTGHA